jgi:hypothetical protein
VPGGLRPNARHEDEDARRRGILRPGREDHSTE